MGRGSGGKELFSHLFPFLLPLLFASFLHSSKEAHCLNCPSIVFAPLRLVFNYGKGNDWRLSEPPSARRSTTT